MFKCPRLNLTVSKVSVEVKGVSGGYQWVIRGLSVDYQRVIRGLSMGYQWVIRGLSEGNQRVISGLSESYQQVISWGNILILDIFCQQLADIFWYWIYFANNWQIYSDIGYILPTIERYTSIMGMFVRPCEFTRMCIIPYVHTVILSWRKKLTSTHNAKGLKHSGEKQETGHF